MQDSFSSPQHLNILYSIIIPAYNSATTLLPCLQAVFGQHVDSDVFEVIVVDDGSTDTTREIALRFPVRYFYQENQGPALARNYGAHQAEGKWLFFLDADCEPAPNWLQEMIKATEGGASGVQGAYLTKQTALIPRLAQLEFQERYHLMSEYPEIDLVATYSAGFSKEIFQANNGFDPSFPKANNEDTEFSYRLNTSGHRLVFAPKANVYHQHPENIWEYLRTKFWRGYWRMEVYRRYPEKAIKDKYTTKSLKIQVIALMAALGFVFLSCIWSVLFWGFLILICVTLFATFFSVLRLLKAGGQLTLLIPFFYFLRSFSLSLGVMYWLSKNILWPHVQKIVHTSSKGQILLIPGDPQGTDSLECIRFIDKKEYTADVFSKYHLDTSLLEQMQLQDLVRKRRLYYYCKRVLDIFLSVLFLIPALPIMLIISVCIRLNSKGPVIFRQERSGLNEQLFEIYKFRTMYADTPKYALSPDDNVSDYRITRLGRILRCTGLDELPQLLNIIKGDMSLVGPRPEMPFLVEEHRSVMWFRSLVKPGLTGIWQLSPFRERQIYEHLEYDLYYLQSQSMLLDLKILMKTICHTFAVLTRKIIDRCRKAI